MIAAVSLWWAWPAEVVEDAIVANEATKNYVTGPRDRPTPPERARQRLDATISGTIRDPQGRPVVATVCATAGGEWVARALTRPVCSASGRDGRYHISGLPGLRHRVVAMAPRFIPTQYWRGAGTARRGTVDLRPGAAATNIDITLADGGVEIHGVVQDLGGGAIEGATVFGGAAASGIGVTSSGPDGEFSLWIRPGRVSVWAEADGYAQGQSVGAAPGHRFELFLTPESVAIGSVVRVDDGAPVSDARVWVDRGEGSGGASGSVFTDADGKFRVDGLLPGAYKVRAEADDAVGEAAEQVVLGLGETSAPIVVLAHPAVYVEGHIVVAGGDVCDNGSVHLQERSQTRGKQGQAEPDGQLRVRGLLPGSYEVQLHCPGHLLARTYPPVIVGNTHITGLRWEVERGQAIRGFVVDARGQPVASLNVGTRQRGDPGDPRARLAAASQITDERGCFELAGLLPGDYQLMVSAFQIPRAVPGEPMDVVLPAGRDIDDLRIELPAAGEVRGSVRDPRGRPVVGAQVQLYGVQTQTLAVADDGSFHFAELVAGEYRLGVTRLGERLRPPGAGADAAQDRRITVRAGATETLDILVEGPAGDISGVVFDEGGVALADAFIEASRESDSAAAAAGEGARQRWRGALDRPRLTEPDGHFTIEGLLPGRYAVRARRRGGGEALVEHVAPGDAVRLTIAATGALAGTVQLPGGAVPPQFRVQLVDRRTGFTRDDEFFRTAGAWAFRELPAGDYQVEAAAPGGTRTLELSLAAGEQREGVQIDLTALLKNVRGTVLDLEGAPVPGVVVEVGGRDEPAGARGNISDEAGRFELAQVPVGVATLRAEPPPGGVHSPAAITVQITGDRAELPPIRVARRRLAFGEDAGDPGYTLRRGDANADPLQRRHVIAVIRPGGPAAAAGLQVGDEIVAVDGHAVTGSDAYLHDILLRAPAGHSIRIGLARGVTVALTLGP